MGLHDVIAAGHQGQCFGLMARRFMVTEQQAALAVQYLLPALYGPFEAWVSSPEGLDGFLSAMSRGGHDRTLETPTIFSNQFERDRGQAVLGQFRQAQEIDSGDIARAATASGVSYRVLLQVLPFVALLMMAAMRTTLDPSARDILRRRLGPRYGQSADPFADLSELVKADAKGTRGSAFGGLFSALITGRPRGPSGAMA